MFNNIYYIGSNSHTKSMKNQRLTLARLEKEEKHIKNDPIPNLIVKRKGVLDFHFCVYNLEGAYAGGYYHGVLKLAEDYPFSPPQLRFYTPSGRFQIDKPICTSFTNFHKEEWSSAWNVRTMLLGALSFMTSEEGGYGSIRTLSSKKQQYAKQSLAFNKSNPMFVQLFEQQFQRLGISLQKVEATQKLPITNPSNSQNSYMMYLLVFLLIVVSVFYMGFKNWQSTTAGGFGNQTVVLNKANSDF